MTFLQKGVIYMYPVLKITKDIKEIFRWVFGVY